MVHQDKQKAEDIETYNENENTRILHIRDKQRAEDITMYKKNENERKKGNRLSRTNLMKNHTRIGKENQRKSTD